MKHITDLSLHVGQPCMSLPVGDGVQLKAMSNRLDPFEITSHPTIRFPDSPRWEAGRFQPVYLNNTSINGVSMEPNRHYPAVHLSQEELDLQQEINAEYTKQSKYKDKLNALQTVEDKERIALQKKHDERRAKITSSKDYKKISEKITELTTKKNKARQKLQDDANRKVDKKAFMEQFLKDTKSRDVNKNASDILKEADAAFEVLNPLT